MVVTVNLHGYFQLNPFRAQDAALIIAVTCSSGAAGDGISGTLEFLRLRIYSLLTAYGKR